MCVSIMGWGCQPWDGVWDVAKASIGIGRGGRGRKAEGVSPSWAGGANHGMVIGVWGVGEASIGVGGGAGRRRVFPQPG